MRSRQGMNGFQGDAERYRPANMSDFEFHSCWRKIDYRNESHAKKAAKRLQSMPFYDDSKPAPAPYLCRFCHSWHIGTRKPKEKASNAKH